MFKKPTEKRPRVFSETDRNSDEFYKRQAKVIKELEKLQKERLKGENK